MTDGSADQLEALTEFFYLVPVGLLQFAPDGHVHLINPLAIQLLMPLQPRADLSNAFVALRPLVPELQRLVSTAPVTQRVLLSHQRCPVRAANREQILSITVHRTHGHDFLAVFEDVTGLLEQERRIYEDQQRLRAIVDNVRDYAIFAVDAQGRVEDWNQSLHRFGGWDADDVRQQPLHLIFADTDRGHLVSEKLLSRARTNGSTETEGWCRKKDGSRLWANLVLTALPDHDGQIRGYVAVARDMTERKKREEELHHLANTDPLTGAFNRRSGEGLLDDAFSDRSRKRGTPAVLMIDIDHFKMINDALGHGAGDYALSHLVEICRTVVDEAGSVIRWGGEEFLIVLPSTTPDDARDVAEKIRHNIKNISLTTPVGPVNFTVSVGVAIDGSAWEDLVQRADTALYVAKRDGRNMVVEG